MNRERLQTLATFLRTVPSERFNLNTWVGSWRKPWGGLADISCGTTACAMGWATTIPEFSAAGLHLKRSVFNDGTGVVVFGGEREFAACAAFFDIDHEWTEFLFSPDSYNPGNDGSSNVANRIEALLREDEDWSSAE